MKRSPSKHLILVVIILFISIVACKMPGQSGDAGATGTIQALETEVARLQSDSDEAQDPEQETEQEAEQEADPVPTATITPQPTIEHFVRPGEPGTANTWVTDTSTKAIAHTRESGADLFYTNQYERPFTSIEMDYQAYIDLTRVNLSFSDPWIYVTFNLEGSPPPDSTATYALELDLTSDGRGDSLILGQVPPGTEWTTDGAKAYQDLNNDVGGPGPMSADPPNSSRDGYETIVFDEGIGTDPDAVWVRRDPGDSNNVQLAFKYSLIGNDNTFAFGGWADDGLKNPGAYDYNDFMTFDEAGSAFASNSRYPIKELALVDSTCRWAYGFTPTTAFPGLCPLPATPVPPGSISGGVWNDMNNNGGIDSGEGGLSGIKVKLGAGSCSSTGMGNQNTNSSGAFTFSDLEPGTYCVTVVNPDTTCSGWVPTNGMQRTVTVGPGEAKLIVWFGLVRTIC